MTFIPNEFKKLKTRVKVCEQYDNYHTLLHLQHSFYFNDHVMPDIGSI